VCRASGKVEFKNTAEAVRSPPAANVNGAIPTQHATAHSRTGGLLVHSKSQTRLVILTCTGLLLPLAIIAATQAQAPPPDDSKPPQVESVAAQSPFIAERAPRPIAEVNAFIEGSSRTNDATIEIRLGSSRLLTFKQPLAKAGGENPVIAFSDPRIADFEILPNNRMLRLVGFRPGNSDLSITTSDGDNYRFLVNVVFDLAVIRTTINKQFPTASVSINQLREHLILTGQTRSAAQSRKIGKTVGDLIPSKTPERIVAGGSGTRGEIIEVRIVNLLEVVYDLDSIATTIKDLYPDASVRVNQVQSDIILTGTVPGSVESADIEKTVADLISPTAPESTADGGGNADDVTELRISNLLLVVYQLDAITERIHSLYPDSNVSVFQHKKNIILTGETRSAAQAESIVKTVETLTPAQKGDDVVVLNRLRVNYDVDVVAASINELFPDSSVSIRQHGGDIVLAGQVRSVSQATEIEETVRALMPQAAGLQILSRLQIPGPNQVMLRVQIAELNRTAMREIGASFLFSDSNSIITSPVGGALPIAPDIADSLIIASTAGLNSALTAAPGAAASAIGIFDSANFAVLFRALRDNSFMKILAEPNLVAVTGHSASFLAGGEIPIVVGGAFGSTTIEYKQFGVQLEFTPTILPDDMIRLRVAPEVSSLDFANALTLRAGASPIPGLISRRVDTTVELREGQTLMLAGLLQVDLAAQTQRIPGLGDLPVLGTFFRNSTSSSVEKELVVMVTPYIVDAIDEEDAPALPGDDIQEANESEFYLYGRIEGCAAGFRSTTDYPRCRELIRIEDRFVQGLHGYSNCGNCR
jgi:pilus assembly protein CpaC